MVDRTWKQAIDMVLNDSDDALHYKEITDRIIEKKLKKGPFGSTPAATVNTQITSSIRKNENESPYIRVSDGVFTLKNKKSNSQKIKIIDEAPSEIITSLGIYWRREHVQWKAAPKLMGMQTKDADLVDFCDQIGIYLLYDGREVVYVGRTTDRPLGKRLYEHTYDRLATRWDRFSWFGLKPVSEKGALGKMSQNISTEVLIPALEAILIESLEPRQNRKRGDDLSAVEYLQKIDANLEKQQLINQLQSIIKIQD